MSGSTPNAAACAAGGLRATLRANRSEGRSAPIELGLSSTRGNAIPHRGREALAVSATAEPSAVPLSRVAHATHWRGQHVGARRVARSGLGAASPRRIWLFADVPQAAFFMAATTLVLTTRKSNIRKIIARDSCTRTGANGAHVRGVASSSVRSRSAEPIQTLCARRRSCGHAAGVAEHRRPLAIRRLRRIVSTDNFGRRRCRQKGLHRGADVNPLSVSQLLPRRRKRSGCRRPMRWPGCT